MLVGTSAKPKTCCTEMTLVVLSLTLPPSPRSAIVKPVVVM